MPTAAKFPSGEPQGEAPRTGYCMTCGVECAWPNDGSAWPEACPNGCAPFAVSNYLPEPRGITYPGTLKLYRL